MYDFNEDAEERMRKLAKEQLMMNTQEQMSTMDMTPTIPAPEIAVAPPQVQMAETSMMDQMQSALANYQGMAPIQPIVGNVTRGNQPINAIDHKMAPYGQGLMSQGLLDAFGEDEDKKAKFAEMAMKMMGGA